MISGAVAGITRDGIAFVFIEEKYSSTGTSAIPQIGHFPGLSMIISGCIGPIHFPASDLSITGLSDIKVEKTVA